MTTLVGFDKSGAYANLNAGNASGLGDVAEDHLGNRYQFVLASGAVAQYDAVHIGSTYVAQALTSALAASGAPVGVAMGTLSSASYGWTCIKGVTTVNALQTCASSTALYTSGTAGKLDDTTTSHVKVAGIVLTTANATTGTVATACIIAGNPYAAI